MQIKVEIPTELEDAVAEYLDSNDEPYDVHVRKGSDAVQIADFVLTYGPGTLAIVNGLLQLIINLDKVRNIFIKIDEEDKNEDRSE